MATSSLAFPRISSVLLAVALGSLAFACGAPQNPRLAALSKLPVYEGKDAQLFDDTIEPAAFGMSMDRPHFRGDAKFRARAQAAGSLAQMKVTTVTIDKLDEKATYHLVLKRADRLGGADEDGLEIVVKEGAPGYSVIAQVKARARDKTVVAMWKHFRVGDEDVIHYYFAPDDQETVMAAKEAMALQEVNR